jgi:bifunctional ADP-heptose synthase (sugar kinase/adenylyltransferase)
MSSILVIGETCRDVFVYCDSNRLCPEAPVPVLNCQIREKILVWQVMFVETLRVLSGKQLILHQF